MFERPTILVLIGACVIGLFAWLTAASPSYSFHPFCTYGEAYKLNATIEVDGQAYSSEVVRQTTKSRDWIYNLNSNGCAATHGTALSFRLPDNSVVLLRATLCLNGIAALKKAHKIDVAQYCDSVHINRPSRNPGRYADGYIVNDAEQPAFWTRLW